MTEPEVPGTRVQSAATGPGTDEAPGIEFATVLASAVHDMKNSLGMLLHSLDELREDHPESLAGAPRFNTLQYEAERVHNDLIQLLGIYRIDERTLTAHSEEQFVPDFLSDHMARHEPLLEGYGIDYAVVADDITGFFDADLIMGVLNNTLNNAIRYTNRTIRLSARQEPHYLVLAVEDDGRGYPEQMQQDGPVTFKTIDFNTGSTSLGLYFAASVAKLHKNGDLEGFIRLHNQGDLGGGVFEIWLP